jgi:hypothetical protein
LKLTPGVVPSSFSMRSARWNNRSRLIRIIRG